MNKDIFFKMSVIAITISTFLAISSVLGDPLPDYSNYYGMDYQAEKIFEMKNVAHIFHEVIFLKSVFNLVFCPSRNASMARFTKVLKLQLPK